jgi:hypothetical protein
LRRQSCRLPTQARDVAWETGALVNQMRRNVASPIGLSGPQKPVLNRVRVRVSPIAQLLSRFPSGSRLRCFRPSLHLTRADLEVSVPSSPTHQLRFLARIHGAVAELALLVVAPAGQAVRQERARVVPAEREQRRAAQPRHVGRLFAEGVLVDEATPAGNRTVVLARAHRIGTCCDVDHVAEVLIDRRQHDAVATEVAPAADRAVGESGATERIADRDLRDAAKALDRSERVVAFRAEPIAELRVVVGAGARDGRIFEDDAREQLARRDLHGSAGGANRARDPACEGTAEAIGTEETCQIMWRRGGPVRVVTVRTKYRSTAPAASTDAPNSTEETLPKIVTTSVPPQILTS